MRYAMLKGNAILFQIGNTEFQTRHILVIGVLAISFTTAFIMRVYPAKYGFYLNEFDPYFNYRATKYIVDHGLVAYLKWHDTMSWYPEGRDIATTSQSGLHILTAYLYSIFGTSLGTSLLNFTIILPVVVGSLTTIIIFALVRVIGGTSAGMFAALLFAFSPPIIERGNLGWFKSEPFGLFFGLLGVYLLLRATKQTQIKYAIIKSALGGVMLGLANASWGGAQYFIIPISLFFLVLPFYLRDTRKLFYIASTFTIFAFVTAVAFPKQGISFILSSNGFALIGPGIGLVFSTIFIASAHLIRKLSHPKKRVRITLFVLTIFIAIAFGTVIGKGVYYYTNAFRYLGVVNPFITTSDPIIESVREHARPDISDYFLNFSTILLFAGYGGWNVLRRRNYSSIFALIIGITGIYVSTTIVRLLVFASIGIIILAAIGLDEIIRIIINTKEEFLIINEERKIQNKLVPYKKQVEDIPKRKLLKALCMSLVILLLFLPIVYPPNFSWLTLADIPPTIVNGGTSYTLNSNDWLDALHWISQETPKGSVIAAWWDYGYWITALGNRISLADNGAFNESRITTIAKMFMEKPENAIRIASNLKANYILTFVVAQRILINDSSFYVLGNGGDESKAITFIRIAGFNEHKYILRDGYTSSFWNSTLLGKLIPFSPSGYTFPNNIKPSTIYHQYKPDAFTIYSKYIKYPKDGVNGVQQQGQPLSLVYISPSFSNNNSSTISAVLIYKVNFQEP